MSFAHEGFNTKTSFVLLDCKTQQQIIMKDATNTTTTTTAVKEDVTIRQKMFLCLVPSPSIQGGH